MNGALWTVDEHEYVLNDVGPPLFLGLLHYPILYNRDSSELGVLEASGVSPGSLLLPANTVRLV